MSQLHNSALLCLNSVPLCTLFRLYLDRHVGGFHVLATVNSTTMDVGVQKDSQGSNFISLSYIPRILIGTSSGNSDFQFI